MLVLENYYLIIGVAAVVVALFAVLTLIADGFKGVRVVFVLAGSAFIGILLLTLGMLEPIADKPEFQFNLGLMLITVAGVSFVVTMYTADSYRRVVFTLPLLIGAVIAGAIMFIL